MFTISYLLNSEICLFSRQTSPNVEILLKDKAFILKKDSMYREILFVIFK